MNKKFFTLMAAAMLLGAPMTEAFAAPGTLGPTALVATDTHELADGVKFILVKTGTVTNPIATEEITTTTNKKTYATIDATSSVNTNAVFEVYNFQANSMAATFQLKVNGKPFALTTSAAAITSGTAANAIYTTFTVPATNGKYELGSIGQIVVVDGTNTSAIQAGGANAVPATLGKEYKDEDLEEFNSTSTTLSFGAGDVEGNVFSGLTPITLTVSNPTFGNGTYFVKGSKDDKAAFEGILVGTTAAQAEAIAKKLTFVSITSAKWGLNTLTPGEGYKLEAVNGAAFFDADAPLSPQNAAFTLKEFDHLNCEGELSMTATMDVDGTTPNVMVVAVKASASDTKTYVTTIAVSGSSFEEYINPQLGSNTYLAATDFLKKDAVSAYNVLFTSGNPVASGKQPYEYGRYLSAVVGLSAFELNATTPDSTNVHAPLSQWIATDFDGKYKLTLASREGGKTLELQLKATGNAGEYKIEGGTGATETITNIVATASDGVTTINTLKDKTIKLVPVALTKNDGYLVLSKEEMSGAITLGFSGKSALAGAATYYLTPDAATPTAFKAALDGDAALKFKREDDGAGNLLVSSYAYLDKDGKVMKDGKDSLYVPMYTLTYGSKPYYLNANTLSLTATAGSASPYFFKEHISGKYAMAVFTSVGASSNVFNASAVSINATNLTFQAGASLNNLTDDKFAYVSLELEDQNDYTTLEAVSRHATLENNLGAVSMQENKNGILEGILSVEPLTFWLDTADSEKTTPAFYISVGAGSNEDEVVTKAYNDEMRLFLFNPKDSATVYNEGTATISTNKKYILEGTTADLKAIFRPAALVAEDTLETVVGDKVVTVVTKDADASKDQVNGLKSFQFGIALADEDVEGEYVVKSKNGSNTYLYSVNGKLGFTASKSSAMVFTLGEGDATANEAIEAAGVQVIGGQGVVTVQGAAGKVITVANILGQTIANQVAASDNVTIAAPAGVVVVAVDGDATKVVVK